MTGVLQVKEERSAGVSKLPLSASVRVNGVCPDGDPSRVFLLLTQCPLGETPVTLLDPDQDCL